MGEFDDIKAGLEDAVAYAKGDTSRGVTHKVQVDVPDVKAIRQRLNLTQTAFARRYRLNPDTVRQWEQERRRPDQPARLLLYLIDKMPDAAAEALETVQSASSPK